MNQKTPPDWVLALLLAVGVFLWQRTVFPPWMVDLFHVQYAAYQFRAGETEWIYMTPDRWPEWKARWQPVAERLGAEGDSNPHYYPPFVAAILSPLSGSPAVVWRNVLLGINCLLLFGFASLILRLCRVPLAPRPFLWALALVLLTYPMARAMQLGQITPLLAVLTWTGLLAVRENKPLRAGTALGLVGSIKLFPLAFILSGVVEKKWRALIAALATVASISGLSLLLLGGRIHELWWAAIRSLNSEVCSFYSNQAPLGWFARAIQGHSMWAFASSQTPMTITVSLVGLALFGGVTTASLWRARSSSGEAFPARVGLLIAGVLLVMPISWEHYWLFALPVLGWAIHETWTRGDRRFWEVWLAVAAFFFCMKLTRFYGDSPFGRVASGSQTMGLILFWVWLVRRAWFTVGKTSGGLAIEKP